MAFFSRKRLHWSSVGWLAPLALVLALAGMYLGWPPFERFVQQASEVLSSGDQQRVERWVRGYGGWGVLVVLVAMFMQSVIAVLPSIATMVAAVLAYGPVWGGLLAWGGMMLTGSFMYGVGRLLGPVTVDRFVGATTSRRIRRLVECYGGWAVVLARLTPLSSSDAVSFIAGALRMRYLRFLLAMAAGTGPLTALIAWLGSDMQRLRTGLIVISAAAVVAFAGHQLWRRLRGEQAPASTRNDESAAGEGQARQPAGAGRAIWPPQPCPGPSSSVEPS